jgi:hypothetical protein
MIYLPIYTTKVLLVVLLALLTFHFMFSSSEAYSSQVEISRGNLGVTDVDETQYLIVLNNLSFNRQCEFIENTTKSYIFNLPPETKNYIYYGYLFVGMCLVFSSRIKKLNQIDE